MTDRPPPEEPPRDADAWAAEPEDPDMAGPGAEFVNEPEDATPGERSGEERDPRDAEQRSFDQKSNT